MELRPRLGCAAIIKNGTRVLLGVRAKEPNRGKWVLPGGGVEFLESLEVTLKREVVEETGLHIQPERIAGVYEIISPPDEHRVILYWWATVIDGTPKASSDLSDVRFFSYQELAKLIEAQECSPIVARVIKEQILESRS